MAADKVQQAAQIDEDDDGHQAANAIGQKAHAAHDS